MRPTSRTVRTTSSASITCATTWSTRSRTGVQRGLNYAIVDEVDSILIDEARTPLIISGPAEDHTETYRRINEVPPLLTRQKDEKGEGDYWVDEKGHQVHISEAGHEKIEGILQRQGLLAEGESLYAPGNIILMHHLNAALRAPYAVPP